METDTIMKAFTELLKLGWVGAALGAIMLIAVVYLKMKKKKAQLGKDIKKAGDKVGDVIKEGESVKDTRKNIDDFMKD